MLSFGEGESQLGLSILLMRITGTIFVESNLATFSKSLKYIHDLWPRFNFWESNRRKLVNPKGNQSWIFIGRTDAEVEAPVLWPPDVKSWLIRKDPDAGKDWGQEEKGTTEGEMAGWHHWLIGHESGWTPGVGYGQGGLACWSPWGCKESDTTEWPNWMEENPIYVKSFMHYF